jgi:hypothetical protein
MGQVRDLLLGLLFSFFFAGLPIRESPSHKLYTMTYSLEEMTKPR